MPLIDPPRIALKTGVIAREPIDAPATGTRQMFKSKVNRVGKHLRFNRRILRHLRKDRSGVTAVEFAFVAAPFLAFILAIMEVSLVYFGGFV
ncbi:MAG: pilus assembly protein, partial [Hyphomicrobiaceae bacterium]|nr:pilus assembly protein [Hyphomicrobiaceae bacterium]